MKRELGVAYYVKRFGTYDPLRTGSNGTNSNKFYQRVVAFCYSEEISWGICDLTRQLQPMWPLYVLVGVGKPIFVIYKNNKKFGYLHNMLLLTSKPVSTLGSRVNLLPSINWFSCRVPSRSCLQQNQLLVPWSQYLKTMKLPSVAIINTDTYPSAFKGLISKLFGDFQLTFSHFILRTAAYFDYVITADTGFSVATLRFVYIYNPWFRCFQLKIIKTRHSPVPM